MSKRLYVGNLPYTITESALQEMFSEAGQVESVKLITDRDTGRSKGFAFVEMATDEAAEHAIAEFNGRKIEGRPMTVNEAKPQQPREGRMGGGGGRRSGFGGR
ncbi:MAG: RNA-binding protein [Acidobacteriia bacterium]|nr:RNA-binding protein [Terriglobia bacterium]